MGSSGKLEAQITVPSGGWNTTVGGVTKTLDAGTYYISSPGSGARNFLEEVESKFGATGVSCSASENGTGIVTITFSGSTAITWVDTEVRDILGFAGNQAGATTHVGTLHARNLWIPQQPPLRLNAGGNWRGFRKSDYRTAMNMAGYVWVRNGQSHVRLTTLEWRGITQAKTWIENETTTAASIEQFWRDGVWGEAAWGSAGGPLRYYPDASVDTDYGTYRPLDAGDFEQMLEPQVRGWVGLWVWKMPPLIQVPGTEAVGVGGTSRATIVPTLRQASSSSTDGTGFTTGTYTPTANTLNIIGILSSHGTTAETPTSVVGCGLTWVLVDELDLGAGTLRRLSVWRAMGSSPSNGALTITFSGTMTSCLWNWVECAAVDTGGFNGSGAVVQTDSENAGAGTTINATLATLEHATNIHLAFVATNAAADITPDAQFAELGDDTETTPSSALESEWAVNQTACDATFSSAQSVIIGIEIKSGTT